MDAAKVTDIAIGFVKENPGKAVESLEGVKKLYDLSSLKPEALVEEIDAFYSKGDNSRATLSAAVTSAKTSLKVKAPSLPQ